MVLSMPFQVGDAVTYKDQTSPDAPRGRIIQRERAWEGERIWLVGWEQPDASVMRLKTPERCLRRL
jgi:hypothetical protein